MSLHRHLGRTITGLSIPALLGVALALMPGIGKAATCDDLKSVAVPNTTITQTTTVAAGAFTAPGDTKISFARLPEFCRVMAKIRPTDDSDIQIEVWLPTTSGWNSKFQAVGNGGWAGSINYASLGAAVERGYAATSTDSGHTGNGGNFALGHPEKLIDYAYRSEHEMVVKGKAILAAYYGRAPKYSYWNGCSSGGRQGMKEAQRYPDDFDGIVAGAPAINWTGRATQAVWVAQAVHNDPSSFIPPEKFRILHDAVLAACDIHDGVKDGILENPRLCKFEPKVLECNGTNQAACLTTPQVDAARKIYSAVINPRTKQVIFPGHEPGSELGWTTMAGPKLFGNATDYFKYVVFPGADRDYKTFDFDADFTLTEKIDNGTINAMDTNLKPFFSHGGKLIQYHGWSDPQISPGSSVSYYENVQTSMGTAKIRDSYRLFMVPGMAHCGGGEGPNKFDMLSALEQWVEKGEAPVSVVAAREKNGKVERTRPLCPYPQVAAYSGTGSTDDAANFACRAQ